jgi:hypothetical protein
MHSLHADAFPVLARHDAWADRSSAQGLPPVGVDAGRGDEAGDAV